MRAVHALLPLACLLPLLSGHAQERVTLRLTDWADSEELRLTEATLREFRKAYPHIDVAYEPNPGRQYEEKILTALAADSPPDVFLLDSKLVPTFTNKHALLDLAPYVSILGIDTAQWFPRVLDVARRGSALYAFPKGFTPLIVFYNRAAFRTAGVPPPRKDWTWDDFLSAAKRLTRDENADGIPERYGTAFTNYFFYWIPWVWTAGGDVVSPDGSRATGYLDGERTRDALEWLIDLRVTHRVAPDAGTWVQSEKTGSLPALFAGGTIAMIVDGHWRMPVLLRHMRERGLELGAAPFPRHPSGEKVNVMYESGWCVPVNSRHQAEAAALAAFMAGPVACRIRSSRMLEIPAVRAVAGECLANDSTGIERTFLEEIPFCRQPWGSRIERFSEIEWTLQDAVDEVMINGRHIDAALRECAARVDGQLNEIARQGNPAFTTIRERTEIPLVLAGVSGCVLLACAALYARAKRAARRDSRIAFGFLAPSLLHLIFFIFTPIAFSAYLSAHRWDVVSGEKPFVGLENFREALSSPDVWHALGNTLVYTLNVPAGMALALGVALMMHRHVRGLGFLRTIYFLPSVTSFVAVALVWMWMYHPTFGAANFLLGLTGLPPLQWLNSPATAMVSVIIFSVWTGIGYQMVVFLAGLQGIPPELHEAATIDGAGSWGRFRHVTWPLLRPTTFFIFVTSLIGSFQVFTTVYIMTAGGPMRSTDVIVYHIYQAAWEQLRMGYASAVSWVLFVIIMIATWVQFRIMGRAVET